jgi:hypothetical protein
MIVGVLRVYDNAEVAIGGTADSASFPPMPVISGVAAFNPKRTLG